MASTDRNTAAGLSEWIGDLPLERLGFLGLVSLLERLTPDAVPVAQEGPPSAEGIRFRHDSSLGFSARDVTQVVKRALPIDPSDPLAPMHSVYEVTTTFLGVTGAVAPVPSYLAEEVAQEDPDHPVQREFLDLFHHRLISLLYRQLIRFQLWAEQTTALRDPWSCRLLALAGLDAYEAPLPLAIPAGRLFQLLPLLVGHARTARGLSVALEAILGDELEGAGIGVCELAGSWAEVEPPMQTRLGVANHRLGVDVLLGRRVFDRSGSFEIRLGPVPRRVYQRFLPDGDLVRLVHEAVALFVRDPLDYRVVVELARGEAPRLRLMSRDGERLGRDSWLGVRAQKTFVTTHPWAGEVPAQEGIAAFSPGE